MGAMLLRNLVWRQHEHCGDGCATAAVLAQAMLAGAYRYLEAGVDPVALQKGMERAVAAASQALRREAQPADGEDDLERVALAHLRRRTAEPLIAELFALLGPDASITVESYTAPYLDREYLEGGRWKARLASPYLVRQPAGELLGRPAPCCTIAVWRCSPGRCIRPTTCGRCSSNSRSRISAACCSWPTISATLR